MKTNLSNVKATKTIERIHIAMGNQLRKAKEKSWEEHTKRTRSRTSKKTSIHKEAMKSKDKSRLAQKSRKSKKSESNHRKARKSRRGHRETMKSNKSCQKQIKN